MVWGQVLVDVLVRAGSDSPATALGRPPFREECRKQIGDTGGCTPRPAPALHTAAVGIRSWHITPCRQRVVSNARSTAWNSLDLLFETEQRS